MTCNEFMELIEPYMENRLTTVEREAFETHMETCEACRIAFQNTVMVIEELHEIKTELPTGFHSDLMGKINELNDDQEVLSLTTTTKRKKVKPQWLAYGSAAAIFLIFLASGGMELSPREMQEAAMEPAAAIAETEMLDRSGTREFAMDEASPEEAGVSAKNEEAYAGEAPNILAAEAPSVAMMALDYSTLVLEMEMPLLEDRTLAGIQTDLLKTLQEYDGTFLQPDDLTHDFQFVLPRSAYDLFLRDWESMYPDAIVNEEINNIDDFAQQETAIYEKIAGAKQGDDDRLVKAYERELDDLYKQIDQVTVYLKLDRNGKE
ncbi:hypothetical protein SANA_12320 [Gottschalkiaceae bacterium SANA]|nr:hypothetical protein SANA_12320 [Gottschalkiaceae bacterium SANA]